MSTRESPGGQMVLTEEQAFDLLAFLFSSAEILSGRADLLRHISPDRRGEPPHGLHARTRSGAQR